MITEVKDVMQIQNGNNLNILYREIRNREKGESKEEGGKEGKNEKRNSQA